MLQHYDIILLISYWTNTPAGQIDWWLGGWIDGYGLTGLIGPIFHRSLHERYTIGLSNRVGVY